MPDFSSPASLGSRILAFGLDYLLISGYLVLLGVVTFAAMNSIDEGGWNWFFSSPLRADALAFLTTIFPVSLYFALTESSSNQASWGKKRRRLKVESLDGKTLSFSVALLRSLLKFLPWQIAHTCLFNIPGWPINPGSPPRWTIVGLSLVWILVLAYVTPVKLRDGRQTLYDWMLGTRVVGVA